jgi:hypothetical protein
VPLPGDPFALREFEQQDVVDGVVAPGTLSQLRPAFVHNLLFLQRKWGEPNAGKEVKVHYFPRRNSILLTIYPLIYVIQGEIK